VIALATHYDSSQLFIWLGAMVGSYGNLVQELSRMLANVLHPAACSITINDLEIYMCCECYHEIDYHAMRSPY
jgi:hypothetical protein